jgi:hypothetical protein
LTTPVIPASLRDATAVARHLADRTTGPVSVIAAFTAA